MCCTTLINGQGPCGNTRPGERRHRREHGQDNVAEQARSSQTASGSARPVARTQSRHEPACLRSIGLGPARIGDDRPGPAPSASRPRNPWLSAAVDGNQKSSASRCRRIYAVVFNLRGQYSQPQAGGRPPHGNGGDMGIFLENTGNQSWIYFNKHNVPAASSAHRPA